MRKNVQGSTLIEVVVALAVVIIAIGIITSAVTTSGKMIERSKEYSDNSATGLNGIINSEGEANSYDESSVDITYYLGGVSINPNGVIRKVTNGNAAFISFVPNNTPDDGTPDDGTPDDGTSDDDTSDDNTPDDNTPDDGTSDDNTPDDGTSDDGTLDNQTTYIIPGTTVEVNVVHPEYRTVGNHKMLKYKAGTTIVYNNDYYYVKSKIQINHYDSDSDPYEVISDNMDKLIKFTGVNHLFFTQNMQMGDTYRIGNKYYIYTGSNSNAEIK